MQLRTLGRLRPKKLIVFDLDGTLAATKAPVDREMSALLGRLLERYRVAVIGGGKYPLFRTQFLRPLAVPRERLANLYLFPTTGTAFYRHRKGWKKVYARHLSKDEKRRIRGAFAEAFRRIGYRHPEKTYGKIIEDRGTQMTFSALGQEVVALLGKKKGVALKEKWKREHTGTKMRITREVAKLLPDLEVRAAGHTSVDVTKKGIDKAYGLRQMEKYLGVPVRQMLFVGDAIFPGGNDHAVVRTGVDYVKVSGPDETKRVIRALLTRES